VAGAANSTSVIGVELLAALDQGGIVGAAGCCGWGRLARCTRRL
jgi:hypothetical protein